MSEIENSEASASWTVDGSNADPDGGVIDNTDQAPQPVGAESQAAQQEMPPGYEAPTVDDQPSARRDGVSATTLTALIREEYTS